MGAWVVFALIAAALSYWLVSYLRLRKRFGAALVAYNAGAFVDVIEPAADERFVYVTRLAREIESKKGVLAIVVPTQSSGMALHHINKNGTFSTKGPYYVSRHSHNWRVTGKTHLVKVLRGKRGWGFKPDHYNQTGTISEKGVAILEYNTDKYFPLGLYDFVELQHRTQQNTPSDVAKPRG